MDDLLAFLNARLDEDEAAAKEATPGPWYAFNSGHGNDWYVGSRAYGLVSTGLHSDPDGDEILMIERDRRDAAHIARHDPARVLREVEAKRAILDRHMPHQPAFGGPACNWCSEDVDHRPQIAKERWPCPDVRSIAAIYSDHPDYRPEWKPSL